MNTLPIDSLILYARHPGSRTSRQNSGLSAPNLHACIMHLKWLFMAAAIIAISVILPGCKTTKAPTITAQPTSVTVTDGGSATFSVTASGSGTLSYQWYKSSAAISGATSASYTISSVTSSDAGSYYVVITNTYGTAQSDTVTLTIGSSVASCDTTYVNAVINAINAYESALGSSLTSSLLYSSSAYSTTQLNTYKTLWSNLPEKTRPGLKLSQMTTAAQISAFNTLASTALSTQGYLDFQGILASDDYLGYTKNANGYGAEYYQVAVVGTPSETGLWTLMFGGHHMAFNLTFNDGCMYPTPHHVGVEPRTTFAANNHYATSKGTAVYASGNYMPLAEKGDAMFAIFNSLSSSQLASAYLSGQTFSDVLVGPAEYNTGSYSSVQSKFAAVEATSNRGLLLSSLSSAQQDLITAAITQYVGDYDETTRDRLLADYQADFGSTYVAWANASGSSSSVAPSVSSSGSYIRIDGPRVWIEIAIQNGVIISNQTHYHMIYRDKSFDYYNELSN